MKQNEKEIMSKTVIRTLILLIAFFSFLTGIVLVIGAIGTKEEKELLVHYDVVSDITHQFHLKENEFYEDGYTGKNVLREYIETINLTFLYQQTFSKKVDSKVSYQVDMSLKNEYSTGKGKEEVWTKEEELIPKKEENITSNANIYIKDTVTIDYEKYRNLAEQFKMSSGVLIDSYLEVTFTVQEESLIEEKEMTEDSKVVLKIPLSENITSIEKTKEKEKKETIYQDKTKNINTSLLVVGILITSISSLFLVHSLKQFLEVSEISRYVKEKNKIMRRYKDIIAETTTRPNIESLDKMEITNFEDLVNIEDELRIPILYYEAIKGKESWFIIIHDNKAYRYLLKSMRGK